MDALLELISSLNPEEHKELERLLKARNLQENRKDLQLLKILKEQPGLQQDGIIRKLYQLKAGENIAEKRKAYYQWRYLLSEQIEDFCFRRITEEDALHEIVKRIMIARFLLNRKRYKIAYKYLHEAEEIALKEQQHEMLQRIYSLQIEYAWSMPALDIKSITGKWKSNALLAQKDAALNVSLNLIRRRLSEAQKEGERVDADKLTEDILNEYGTDEEVNGNANTLFKLSMIVATVMEEKKSYREMVEYLIKKLDYMDQRSMFNRSNYHIKIEMLTSIARFSLKGGDYSTAEKYLDILQKEHALHPEYTLLNIKSMMIKYVFLCFTGRLDEGQAHIKSIENSYMTTVMQEDDYFFWALNNNLISSNYFLGNLAGAKKYSAVLINNEKRIKNLLGVKGLITAHLTDCLINIDLKNYEYVISRLKALQKRYAGLWDQPEYYRYKLFLSILRELASDKDETSHRFRESVQQFLSLRLEELGTYETVSFAPYLVSKLEGRNFYEVLMEWIREGKL
jgi:hypothetical protein